MPVDIATRPPADRHAPAAPETVDDELRTRLTISRTSPRDCGQRQVFVRLDGGPRIALVFEDSHTLELQPGRHRFWTHNTLMWRTIDFSVEPGEHLQFQLVNRANWITLSLAMWLGTGPLYLDVERRSLR